MEDDRQLMDGSKYVDETVTGRSDVNGRAGNAAF
jgi:hypothetical protein